MRKNPTRENLTSAYPFISPCGRYVVFNSTATNLVPENTNGEYDVFMHDLDTGETTLISVASDGTYGNNGSGWPSISADGRYVAFHSTATNLVPGDTSGEYDIYVHDRQTGETTLVSVASDGTKGNDYSDRPTISADGRYVAFVSRANNLVPVDTNNKADVFVHDLETGETTRVSVASDGSQGSGTSYTAIIASISGDGRFVAFDSDASDLVPDDTNSLKDVFVHETGDRIFYNYLPLVVVD